MRMLLTTSSSILRGNVFSTSYLAQQLASKGHEVLVGCRPKTLVTDYLQAKNIPHVNFPFRNHWDRESVYALRDIVRTHKIDIIFSEGRYDRTVVLRAKYLYRLAVRWVHIKRSIPVGASLWYMPYVADHTVAVSQAVYRRLKCIGFRANRTSVIRNGTPTAKYALPDIPAHCRALREKHHIREDIPVIGCISALKRQPQLLRALRGMSQDICVLFIGLEENKRLRKLKETLGLKQQIIYIPTVSYQEILYYIKLLTVQVQPSVRDGIAQSILEAMSLGVPVVATRSCNAEVIAHEKTGLLFDNGDCDTLRKHLELLLKDKVLRHTLTQAAKKSVKEDFSMQRVGDEYEILAKRLLSL